MVDKTLPAQPKITAQRSPKTRLDPVFFLSMLSTPFSFSKSKKITLSLINIAITIRKGIINPGFTNHKP